jgi:hypothetical protein
MVGINKARRSPDWCLAASVSNDFVELKFFSWYGGSSSHLFPKCVASISLSFKTHRHLTPLAGCAHINLTTVLNSRH